MATRIEVTQEFSDIVGVLQAIDDGLFFKECGETLSSTMKSLDQEKRKARITIAVDLTYDSGTVEVKGTLRTKSDTAEPPKPGQPDMFPAAEEAAR
jgi:hypothetical protein